MDKDLTLERVIGFLLETPLFDALDPAELSEIVHIMQVQGFRDGQSVFREGDEGDAWYVLFKGQTLVTKEVPFGPSRQLARLEPHACFGEMAILDGSARSALVRASGDVTVFRFPRIPFQRLLDEGNLGAYKLVLAMARILCQRQRDLTQRITEMAEESSSAHEVVRSSVGPMLDSWRVSQ